MGAVKRILGVRFKHQALADASLSVVKVLMELLRKLIEEVVLIELLSNVNLTLGALKGVEVPPELLVRGISVDEETNHEASIHDLSEPLLLQHI